MSLLKIQMEIQSKLGHHSINSCFVK